MHYWQARNISYLQILSKLNARTAALITTLAFSFLALSQLSAQQKVVSVEIIGLSKTKTAFAKSFVKVRPGVPLDSTQVASDAQELRNLRLFAEVDYRVLQNEDGVAVQFLCKENTTFLPVANFGSIEDNFWFQLGAVENNWLGRANMLGLTYRYYDRHSFETWLKSPYFFSRNWGGSAYLNLFATIEPAYFSDGTTIYNVDRWTSLLFARRTYARDYVFETGGGYLREKYDKNFDRTSVDSPGPTNIEFDKLLLRTSITVNKVDYFAHYVTGLLNESSFETIKTFGASDLFWKIENILRYYYRPYATGNFALRLRTGLAQNNDSPFAPFVLDSYLTVRGAGDRVARGTAEITLNAEMRQTVFELGWGAMQAVVFTDWSAWRPGGGELNGLFESENVVSFFGFGGRLYLKQFNHLILRADYGFGVTGVKQRGLVIGLGQYF